MATATTNGLQIFYETLGEGEPLVLIMGLGAQIVYWPEGFCQLLNDRGFRLILFDHRDVGLSGKVSAGRPTQPWRAILRAYLGCTVDAPYTLGDMAGDIAAILDALDLEAAHIAGVSLGGMIGQVLATERPDRVLTLTSIMSTTGARRYVGRPRALRAMLRRPGRTREAFVDNAVHFFRAVNGPRFPLDEPDLRERAGQAFDRCFYPRGLGHHFLAVLAAGNRTRDLSRVRAPTLVIHGSDDPLIPPRAGRATARAIPNARFELIEGMGHSLPEAVWPTVADLVAAHARAKQGT